MQGGMLSPMSSLTMLSLAPNQSTPQPQPSPLIPIQRTCLVYQHSSLLHLSNSSLAPLSHKSFSICVCQTSYGQQPQSLDGKDQIPNPKLRAAYKPKIERANPKNISLTLSISSPRNFRTVPDLCQVQGFFVQVFVLSSAMWTGSIAVTLVAILKYDRPLKDKLAEKWFLAINWLLPIAIASCLFIASSQQNKSNSTSSSISSIYGRYYLWCWISMDYTFLRAGIQIPIWMTIMVSWCIYVYFGITARSCIRRLSVISQSSNCIATISTNSCNSISSNNNNNNISSTSDIYHRNHPPLSTTANILVPSPEPEFVKTIKVAVVLMFFLFLGFSVVWIPTSVSRIYYDDDLKSRPSFGILAMQAALYPLQGFLTAALYFWPMMIWAYSQASSTAAAASRYSSSRHHSKSLEQAVFPLYRSSCKHLDYGSVGSSYLSRHHDPLISDDLDPDYTLIQIPDAIYEGGGEKEIY